MHYNHYIVLRPSGEIEKVKVPVCIDIFTLPRELRHSITVLLSNGRPTYIKPDGTGFELSKAPTTERDFNLIVEQFG